MYPLAVGRNENKNKNKKGMAKGREKKISVVVLRCDWLKDQLTLRCLKTEKGAVELACGKIYTFKYVFTSHQGVLHQAKALYIYSKKV